MTPKPTSCLDFVNRLLDCSADLMTLRALIAAVAVAVRMGYYCRLMWNPRVYAAPPSDADSCATWLVGSGTIPDEDWSLVEKLEFWSDAYSEFSNIINYRTKQALLYN